MMQQNARPNLKTSTITRASGNRFFTLKPATKVTILALSAVVMIFASIYAVVQPLRPDPRQAAGWQQFWYPVETNAYNRLPAVSCANDYACRFNSIVAVGKEDEQEVWAVGNRGLVLYRAAGQQNWKQLQITATEATQQPDRRTVSRPTAKRPLPPRTAKPPAQKPSKAKAPGKSTAASLFDRVSDMLAPTVYAAEGEAPQAQALPAARPPSGQQDPRGNNSKDPKWQGLQQTSPSSDPRQQTAVPNRSQQSNVPVDTQSNSNSGNNPASQTTPGTAPNSGNQATQKHTTPRPSRRSQPHQATAPSAPLTVDDDLLYVSCEQPSKCQIIGRTGRFYRTDDGTKWTYSNSTFLDKAGKPLKSLLLLRAYPLVCWGKLPDGSIGFFASRNSNVFDYKGNAPLFEVEDNALVVSRNSDGTPIYDSFTGAGTAHWSIGGSGFITILPANSAPFEQGPKILTGTTASLRWMSFPTQLEINSHLWIAGDDGTILSSTDGGRNWLHETQGPEGKQANHRWPAPWYWSLALVLVIFCSAVITAPEPTLAVESSVADWTVTDAPLKPGEHDVLDFAPVVLGLSRFIRNPKTQPPVTIAIEGKWGEGKSSLMSLLCGDLKKSRFRPVWFNAWHHQTEEQLLASLLEHIRTQGVPQWWHLDNWIFRGRLLWIRFHQMWPIMLLVGMGLIGSAAYEYAHQQEPDHQNWKQSAVHLVAATRSAWGSFWNSVHQAEEKKSEAAPEASPQPQPNAKPQPAGDGNGIDPGGYTLAGSMLAFLVAVLKKFRAFASDPGKLAENLKEGSSIGDVKLEPGIRRQFAREFKDICEAWSWGGRRVIIFIDDLDRCRPDSVVTVLESVNFLTSAGECIVVLGIAQETVTHCVGLSFKEIAEAHAFFLGCEDTEEAKAKARFEYGESYIRKLINISAPLPKTTPEQRKRVLDARLAEQAEETAEGKTRRERLWHGLSRTGTVIWKFAPVLLILILCIVSARLGYRVGTLSVAAERQELAVVAADSSQPAEKQTGPLVKTESNPGAGASVLAYTTPTREHPKFDSNDHARANVLWRSYPIYLLLPLFLASFIAYVLTARSNQDAENSEEFEEALQIWCSFIVNSCDTPRELKRALNDLRYQAMMRRKEGPSTTRLERIVARLRRLVTGQKTEGANEEIYVHEADLPARKVLELIPLSVVPEEQRERFIYHNDTQIFDKDSAVFKNLMQAKQKHIERFGSWLGQSQPASPSPSPSIMAAAT